MNSAIIKFCAESIQFVLAARRAIFILALTGFAISSPLAFAQPDPSIFDQQRYVPQETPPPRGERSPSPSRSIPRTVLIAGAAVLLMVSGIVLFKSARAWRSANLFDRQYRFPTPGPAELRFGGNRCGGQLATLKFRGAAEATALAKSDREKA